MAESSEKKTLNDCLMRQAQHILSEVHYLAFHCDLLYSFMVAELSGAYGRDFFSFYGSSLTFYFHVALEALSENVEHHSALLNKVIAFIMTAEPFFNILRLASLIDLGLDFGHISKTGASIGPGAQIPRRRRL